MAGRLVVCVNFRPFSGQPSCAGAGSRELVDWLENEIRARRSDIAVERIVCMGHCSKGPNVKVVGGEMIHGASKETLLPVLERLTQEEEKAGDGNDEI